jgi:hypothetical protein
VTRGAVNDTGLGHAGDAHPGCEAFLNCMLVSIIVIDTSEVVTDTVDYAAMDNNNCLTATLTRTVLIEAATAATTTDH